MTAPNVLVVLTNYRRPYNLPLVVEAWKGQSLKPWRVVVVDNSPFGAGVSGEGYPNLALAGADDVWRFRENAGCACRWGPALTYLGYDYALFADDDLLPGSRALEYAVKWAGELSGEFATLSTQGRDFRLNNPPGERYRGNWCPTASPTAPVRTDMSCQVHLVRADAMPHVIAFRHQLLAQANSEAERGLLLHLLRVHDDFALSLGTQKALGYPSYVLPTETDPECKLVKQRLDEGGVAVWRRPQHFPERNAMVDYCLRAGWTSRRPVLPRP